MQGDCDSEHNDKCPCCGKEYMPYKSGEVVAVLQMPEQTGPRPPTQKDIDEFVARCQKIVDADMAQYPTQYKTLMIGIKKRYCVIWASYGLVRGQIKEETGKSAWAFIDMENGDVLKPAGCKKPAKHARGNLFDEHQGIEHISAYGPAYLK